MGVASEILGNSAPPHTIEHQGETFALRLIDEATASAFEKGRYAQARAALGLLAKELTREEYADRLAVLGDRYANGEYEMVSDQGLRYLATLQGTISLVCLLSGQPRKSVVPLVMAKQAEVRALVRLILKESWPGLKFKDEEEDEGEAAAKGGAAGDPNG